MSAPLARAAKGRSVAGPVAPWWSSEFKAGSAARARGLRGRRWRAWRAWRRRKLPRRASFPRPGESPPSGERHVTAAARYARGGRRRDLTLTLILTLTITLKNNTQPHTYFMRAQGDTHGGERYRPEKPTRRALSRAQGRKRTTGGSRPQRGGGEIATETRGGETGSKQREQASEAQPAARPQEGAGRRRPGERRRHHACGALATRNV
jgi:hypothetical protein